MNQADSTHITLNSISALDEARIFRDSEIKPAHHQAGAFKFLLFLVSTFYAPSALIWLGVISFEYRFVALLFVVAILSFHCLRRRYSLYELGFRIDNLYSSLRWNLIFCAVGAIGLYLTHTAEILRPRSTEYLPYIYVLYIFFLGPVQEIVFRGILFAEMKRIRICDHRWILLVSTLSFCFLHIIYNHPPLLIITFVSGLTWGIIFSKRPNIWGISLSHSLLGALAMFLGVI